MQIVILPCFKKHLKSLTKKFPDLKDSLIESLEAFDAEANGAILIRENLYKIKFSTKSLKRGKSKSFRLIVLRLGKKPSLIPVFIFHKSKQENISAKELNRHLEMVLFEVVSINSEI